ncbi:MAG: Npt1/Npt2 family nucleotide transporter [Gammaproteobacteria bacterium]|jgi:AAA family ATP:ADP antiporter
MKYQIQVAAMMACAAMFTLAGYEFIRSASTVLFKNAYGAENLPLVMAVMPLVVLGGIAIYARILSALGPRKTLLVTTLGSGFLIFCCYLAVISGFKEITPVLFLLKEFYIVLLIEQYWSYINSNLDADGAKKLNGPITGLAGLGGAAGGLLVGATATSWGTEAMLLIAALTLIPAALISNFAYHRFGDPELPEQVAKQGQMGWGVIKQNKTLTYLLIIVLLSQLVAAVLDFKFQGLLSIEFAGRADEETAFQGRFWGTLNSSVLLLQFVLIPIFMSLVSLRLVHILMPTIHLIAITIAVIEPTIWTVGVALFLFKAFDYSLFRAAKEVLYVPLGFDARYRAKEFIDIFGYRTGKGGSSVGIVALQNLGVAMSAIYLPIAFAATAIWLALIFPLTKHADKQSRDY